MKSQNRAGLPVASNALYDVTDVNNVGNRPRMKTKIERLEERNAKLNDQLNNVIDRRDALEIELAKAKEELSTLVAWIAGDGADALTVLQRLYLNTEEPTANRIKAASAAINFERARPASTTLVVDFREKVRQARLWADARLLEQAPKTIEHTPSDTSEPASTG